MGFFRLFLALAVVIHHLSGLHGFVPLGGNEAVETFFMISGFYMAMILTEKYKGKGSYRLFLSNRFLRIFPLYWCVLTISIPAYLLYGHLAHEGATQFLASSSGSARLMLILSNIAIFGQDLIYFMGTDGHHVYLTTNYLTSTPMLCLGLLIPPAWSLSVELIFYLFAPLLVRRTTGVIVSLIAIALCVRFFLYGRLNLTFDPWAHRFLPTELAFFLAGALAYRMCGKISAIPKYLLPLSIAFFVLCLAYQFVPSWTCGGFMLKQWAFYPIAWFAIPVLFLLSKSSRIDRWIGELSYPIYIIHWPVLTMLPFFMARVGLHHANGLLTIFITLALSIALNWLVAMPLERLRQRRVRKMQGKKSAEPAMVTVN